jgi:thiol-disulfide isomerase/thioredoxin
MKRVSLNCKTAFIVASAPCLAVALAGCSNSPSAMSAAQTSSPPTPAAQPPSQVPCNTSLETDANKNIGANLRNITWFSSYDKALQTAKKNNKPVMIDFYADWCGACKYLDQNIYTAPGVIKESKKFINLRINTDKDTDIVQHYKVYGLPTLVFLDGNGKVLWRLDGAPAKPPYFIKTMKTAESKFITGT